MTDLVKLNFKFAIVSDLHIALPHTVWDAPKRFHLVEISIPAFEQILTQLTKDQPDFLLLPGDLVQHGERENHEWLADRLFDGRSGWCRAGLCGILSQLSR